MRIVTSVYVYFAALRAWMRSSNCLARNCFGPTTLKPELTQSKSKRRSLASYRSYSKGNGSPTRQELADPILANERCWTSDSLVSFQSPSIDKETLRCVASCLAVNLAASMSDARKYELPRGQYLHDTKRPNRLPDFIAGPEAS